MTYKSKKILLTVTMIFLLILFSFSLSLFLYQKAYAGKILNNVYYNDINLSGKSKAQIKTIIQNDSEELLENKIITKSLNEKTYEATFSQAGFSLDLNNTANQAYSYGRDQNFFKTIYKLTKTAFNKENVKLKLAFDEKEYGDYVVRNQENLNMPPVDASLSITNGTVSMNTGKNGLTIDATGLKEQLLSEFYSKSEKIIIDIPTKPVTPTLLTENLSTAKNTAESYLSHSLNLSYNGQIYSVDKNTVSSWISFGLQEGKYNAWLNDSAIKSYLSKIAAKTDIQVIDKKISAVDNTKVLQEGRQGVYLNQEDALIKIKNALKNSSPKLTIEMVQKTKDPQTITVFPDEGIIPGRFPGKYIDVDLTKQLMILFDGANQIGQYIVSSGKASTPTPTGTRTISGRDPKAWSAPYGLYMPWWMSLGGGYGIHELPEWSNGYKEGESHLGTPVSHGCIRLGVGAAQTVYNWAPDGTQVYIHK